MSAPNVDLIARALYASAHSAARANGAGGGSLSPEQAFNNARSAEAALREYVARLERDKARLDWLTPYASVNVAWIEVDGPEIPNALPSMTLRDAIDAAMAAEAKDELDRHT